VDPGVCVDRHVAHDREALVADFLVFNVHEHIAHAPEHTGLELHAVGDGDLIGGPGDLCVLAVHVPLVVLNDPAGLTGGACCLRGVPEAVLDDGQLIGLGLVAQVEAAELVVAPADHKVRVEQHVDLGLVPVGGRDGVPRVHSQWFGGVGLAVEGDTHIAR